MNRLKLIAFSLTAVATLVLSACGGGSSEKSQPTEAPAVTSTPAKKSVDTLAKSVVMVAPGTLTGGSFEPVATGSGTVIDKSGLILTNYHVVDPVNVGAYEDIAIYVSEDAKDSPTLTYFGGLAAWDEELDLAVIRITENRNGIAIEPKDVDLPVVSIGHSSNLGIGDALTVLGYPAIGGGSLELTKGAVSGFLETEGRKQAWIKTDARIAAGNSGGGAFNEAGQLVGIPTAIYYVESLGQEVSGRIRPVDLAQALLKEAKATTTVVIPQLNQPSSDLATFGAPLLSLADLGQGFVLTDESYLSNEDRASSYDNPSEALDYYTKYGRVGGVRRVFDDFDSAAAANVSPTVVFDQVDLYDTAAGADGAVTNCDEYLDTVWEFVTVAGIELYDPVYVSDPAVGEESCLYTAKEKVATAGEPPLLMKFIGFRQSGALVVVGLLSLENTPGYQDITMLATRQSVLLTQAGLTAARRPSSTSSPAKGSASAEKAIGVYLASYDITYAGDCDYTDPVADAGGYCSSLYEDRSGEALYLGGSVASEYDTWFLAERSPDGSWVVTDSTDATYNLSGDLQPPPW